MNQAIGKEAVKADYDKVFEEFDNPMYENEFNVFNFLQHPDILIGQAITLHIGGAGIVARQGPKLEIVAEEGTTRILDEMQDPERPDSDAHFQGA